MPFTELTASDGHRLAAYRSEPGGKPRGGVVVVQEIFGVNSHIRSVCDRVSALGYTALAPALFDRVERGFETGYSDADVELARTYIPRVGLDLMMLDVEAAVTSLRGQLPVAVIGFCLGGSLAFMAAQRITPLACAIGYYGGRVAAVSDTAPLCPTQLHFGGLDTGISLTDVARVEEARPDCDINIYAGGGHGFHCDQRAAYHAPSATRAWQRSSAFLAAHLG